MTPAPKPPQWSFNWPNERPHFATFRSVTDGDTQKWDIDLDLRSALVNYPLRVDGIACGKLGTPVGDAAAAQVAKLLIPGNVKVITLIKDYKYGGEFVGRIWLKPDITLASVLLTLGLALPWDGKGAQPIPAWPLVPVPRPIA